MFEGVIVLLIVLLTVPYSLLEHSFWERHDDENKIVLSLRPSIPACWSSWEAHSGRIVDSVVTTHRSSYQCERQSVAGDVLIVNARESLAIHCLECMTVAA